LSNYGSNSTTIEIDDSGGTPRDLSTQILSINGVTIEAVTEESHGYNKAWAEVLATGMRRIEPVEAEGFFNDAANGAHAVMKGVATGPSSGTRTIKFGWGGGWFTAFETLITKYGRLPKVGAITRYKTTLTPSGQVTETEP
jgi:hypothetical protein